MFIIGEDCRTFNIGIKHNFPFINIHKVPKEVLKTEGKPGGYSLALPLTCTVFLLVHAFYKYARLGPWSGSLD